MKTKSFTLLIFLSLLQSNCAKKGSPTSPDRSPPFLVSVAVLDKNHLMIKFDEDIVVQPAESLCNIKSEVLTVLSSVAAEDKIFLTTSPMDTLDYQINLLNIRDPWGNRKDEYKIKFRGTLNPDTLPPDVIVSSTKIIKDAPPEAVLSLKFSEKVDTSIIHIMPYTRYNCEWNDQKTQLKIQISRIDSMKVYRVYGLFRDNEGNRTKTEYAITRERELPIIWLKGETKDSTIIILTKEGKPYMFTISDTNGIFSIQNIFPDSYTLIAQRENEYLSSGNIKIRVPEDRLSMYHIQENEIDKETLSVLNSLYNTYLGEIR